MRPRSLVSGAGRVLAVLALLALPGLALAAPDAFEDDDSLLGAGVLPLSNFDGAIVQAHDFHDAGDEDWYAVAAFDGMGLTVTLDDVGGSTEFEIALFDDTGTDISDDAFIDSFGGSATVEWFPEDTQLAYLRVRHTDPESFGAGNEYEIQGEFSPGYNGFLGGHVLDGSNGATLPFAMVSVSAVLFHPADPGDQQAPTATLSQLATPNEGVYHLKYDEGTIVDVAVTRTGYQTRSLRSVALSVSGGTLDVALLPDAFTPYRDDVVLDFGATGAMTGLWVYYDDAVMAKRNGNDPLHVAVADLDATGKHEVIFDVGASGLWVLRNDTTFQKINGVPSEGLAAGDLDGNGIGDVVIAFGAAGMWVYRNDAGFEKLNSRSPVTMVVADVDGNGQQDVAVDFGPAVPGLWLYRNDGGFQKINSSSPQRMAAGDVDGDGRDDLVLDYGGAGLWLYLNDGGFARINSQSPVAIATGDVDANGQDDVLLAFAASGLWQFVNASGFQKINSNGNAALALADLDKNGQADVLAAFSGGGLWTRRNNVAPWTKLVDDEPEAMITEGNVDGS